MEVGEIVTIGHLWDIRGYRQYVVINRQGTLRLASRIKWYKPLFLAIYQALGKKKSLPEVLEYLEQPPTTGE